MNRAERRRQAKEMSKSKMPLPLNVALPVERDADITGQEAITLKTYLELKEKEIRENVTAAWMKEAQEKLAKAEVYVDRKGAAAAYAQIKKEMDIEIEFEDLTNYNIYKELGFDREAV